MLSWVDEDTNMLCYNKSHLGTHYTTAGYDLVSFHRPCKAGDRLHFLCRIVYVGNKSVMVGCNVFNLNLDNNLAFSCITTMVRTAGEGLLKDIADNIDPLSECYAISKEIKRIKADTVVIL